MKVTPGFYGAFAVVVGASLVGCGGGSAGSSVASLAGKDLIFGPLTVRGSAGVHQPVTIVGTQSTITGVYGASFTNVAFNLPSPNDMNGSSLLKSTMIAFSTDGRPAAYDYSNGNLYYINQATSLIPGQSSQPSFTGSAGSVITSELEPTSGVRQLFITNLDGSGRTQITNSTVSCWHPTSAPNSSQIVYAVAYYDNNNVGTGTDFYTVNRNGTGTAKLTSTPNVIKTQPHFNPAGTKIGYIVGSQFWEMGIDGSNPTIRASFSKNIVAWSYNPLGTEILATGGQVADAIYSVILDGNTAGQSKNLAVWMPGSTQVTIDSVTWSPDGSTIAFAANRSSDGASTLRSTSLRNSTALTTLIPWSIFSLSSIEWSPLITRKTLISAAGGSLGTGAAGFLFGLSDQTLDCFVAFDATTRSGVSIDASAPIGVNQSNHVVTISAADAITMLRYSNGLLAPVVTIADPNKITSALSGAVVAFSGSTGQVVSVLPFSRSRGYGKPTRTENGGTVTVRGQFTGIWDGSGTETAKSGVSEAIIDGQSGKILSFR